MNRPLKVGVAGCGYWGPNLIRNFRGLPDCQAIEICDMDRDRLAHLERLYPGVKTHTQFDHLLNGANLDAIVIATPVHQHYKLAKESLLSGKHTFIEKPMASSPDECEELVEIAQKKGLVLMVGHTFLYSPPVRKIKQIIDSGDLGTIQYISSRRLNLGLFQKDINVVWDLAPHDLSIIMYLMGETPSSVNCQGTANVTPGIEDVTNMTLQFGSGGFATVHSSWLDPKKVREMTIVGSQRMVVYDDLEPLQKIKIYDTRVERPPHYDTFAEFQYAYHYGDMYAPRIEQEEPLKVECKHFLDCINNGTRPLTCGKSGWDLVKILQAASESLKQQGAAVAIAPPKAKPPASKAKKPAATV